MWGMTSTQPCPYFRVHKFIYYLVTLRETLTGATALTADRHTLRLTMELSGK